MPASQSEWDAKHRLAAERTPAEPASIVRELLPLLPRGPALDLACGTGRHTLLLAERGQHVIAVDWSNVAMEILELQARTKHISANRVGSFEKPGRRAPRGIDLFRMDLDQIELLEQTFDLILCFQYLQRSLFAPMTRALRPGGVLLFETFTRAQLEFEGGPRSPDHLLETGELREAFPALRAVFYRELRAGQGIASLLAQKPMKLS
jgi:tellurite methyltransferase